jgi:probable F420-dependent oxidoreductase
VILESDPAKARTAARNYMQIYLRAPNYINSVKNIGFTDADLANNGSDRLVDAIVAWGNADQIRGRIEAHLKAGANHVCIIPLRVDSKPVPDTKAVEALAPR